MIPAVLIDPYKETITDVAYDGNYRSIHKLIHCDCFTVVALANNQDLFVDDEGLLKLTSGTKFFTIPSYLQPLAGYGLICGVNADGETIATKFNAEHYKPFIRFLTYDDCLSLL